MTKDELRKLIANDISNYRSKADYYDTQHLFEAAGYARKLASNLELSLTTMPSDEHQEIA